MITFVSIGCVSITRNHKETIGQQVNDISEGVSPTYGMTAADMEVEGMIINLTWSYLDV